MLKTAAAPAAEESAPHEPTIGMPEPVAVPEPVAAPEPMSAPVVEPAAEPISAPEAEEPAAEPTSAPEAEDPAAEPTSTPETEEPAAEPTSTPETEEPAAEPTSAPETEEPAAEPISAPEAEEPAAPAEAQVTPEDAAAQSEYDREMEEYNRQMEEYNRQMEEYNRQMAELQAQQAAAEAAAAAAPAPEPEPVQVAAPVEEAPAAETPRSANAARLKQGGAKLAVRKPAAVGGLKKAASAHAAPTAPPANDDVPADDAPAHDGEEENDAESGVQGYDADMLAQLQVQANKKPIWKSKLFLIAVGGLVAVSSLSGYLIMKKNAENEAVRVRNAKVMSVLKRARDINEQRIETLADAKAKGVNVTFTPEEADFLMNIMVNPEMKDDKGKPMFGNKPEATAQLAALGIGLACEENSEICKSILARMDKDAPLIKPMLYRWLVQRLAVTNIKGINSKLRKLADALLKNKEPKFRTREELAAYVWEAMVLRVEEKDIPTIIKQLQTPDIGNQLGNSLLNCLYQIIRMMDDPAKRAEVGDQMFDALNDDMRVNAAESLALACSPKALEYFKARAEDTKNWRTDFPFFANYGNDDIVPFLLELKEKAGDDKKSVALVQQMISGLFSQNRGRTEEEAKKLLALIPVYDKVDVDTSEWSELAEKTDPNAAAYVGDNNPQLPELKKKMEDIEVSRKQKLALVKVLSSMFDYDWVKSYLNKFAAEDDMILAREARKALETVQKNRENDEEMRAKRNSRDKG